MAWAWESTARRSDAATRLLWCLRQLDREVEHRAVMCVECELAVVDREPVHERRVFRRHAAALPRLRSVRAVRLGEMTTAIISRWVLVSPEGPHINSSKYFHQPTKWLGVMASRRATLGTNPIRSAMSPISSATAAGSSSGERDGYPRPSCVALDRHGTSPYALVESVVRSECVQPPLVLLDVDFPTRQAVGECPLRSVRPTLFGVAGSRPGHAAVHPVGHHRHADDHEDRHDDDPAP
jgi:hypothetical protein